MPRRSELKGISAGIATSFISRNNDIDGYWAMGLLYEAAQTASLKKMTLDLLTGKSHPEYKYSYKVAENYREYLFRQLQVKGFSEYQISHATIKIEFDIVPSKRQIRMRTTWGEPFRCTVTLVNDLGRKRAFIISDRCWCGVHDKRKESRSTRRYSD